MERKTHILDASGKAIGRLAVEVSLLLRGKHKPGFFPYKDEGDFVEVKNIKQVVFSGNKLAKKEYIHHTGYIGNLKRTPVGRIFEKDPAKVLRKTVWGMMPKNKLRKEQIKRLKITD